MPKLPKFIPLPHPPQFLLEEPKEHQARMNAYAEQVAKIKFGNLTLLFNYFGIKKTGDVAVDFGLLAMCLADEHVRGFNSHKKLRRPRKDLLELAQLRIDAEDAKRKKIRMRLDHDDTAVVKMLRSQLPYQRRWGEHRYKTAKTLKNLLPKARHPKLDVLVGFLRAHPEAFQPDK